MKSVHYFSKTVAGVPLKRPPWFFDVRQEGEGIVDTSTHLVDLIQWEAFPGTGVASGGCQRAERTSLADVHYA